MRNILALVGAAVIGFGVLGWYLGWYKVGAEPSVDGHRKINVDVNTKKIVEDVRTGEQKVINLLPGDNKGTPPAAQKDVPGQTTGFQFNPDGSVTITPPKVEFKSTGN